MISGDAGRGRSVSVRLPQQRLYFWPLPQGQGWLRPIFVIVQ
jgi:hypothetical protein